jgi:hypothetical protein
LECAAKSGAFGVATGLSTPKAVLRTTLQTSPRTDEINLDYNPARLRLLNIATPLITMSTAADGSGTTVKNAVSETWE